MYDKNAANPARPKIGNASPSPCTAHAAPSTVPRAHATHGPRVPGHARVHGGAISGKTRGSKRTRKFFGGGLVAPSAPRRGGRRRGTPRPRDTICTPRRRNYRCDICTSRTRARRARRSVQARDEGFEPGGHVAIVARTRGARSIQVEVVAFARHAGAVRRAEPPAKRDVAEYHDAADGDVGERVDRSNASGVSVQVESPRRRARRLPRLRARTSRRPPWRRRVRNDPPGTPRTSAPSTRSASSPGDDRRSRTQRFV